MLNGSTTANPPEIAHPVNRYFVAQKCDPMQQVNILASRSTRSLNIATQWDQWVSWDTTLKLSLTKPRRSASVASSPFLLSWSAWWQMCGLCKWLIWKHKRGPRVQLLNLPGPMSCHSSSGCCNGDCKLATWRINHQTVTRWAPSRFFWLEFFFNNPYQWPNING